MKHIMTSTVAWLMGLVLLTHCGPTTEEAAPGEGEEVGVVEGALQYCESSCTGWGDTLISCSSGACSSYSNRIVCDGVTRYCRCAEPLTISATLTGNNPAYDEYITVTANVPAGGPYTYTWTESWCRNGTAAGDCSGRSVTFTGGQSVTKYISRYDVWKKLCVTATDTSCSASQVSNTVCKTILGGGECPPNMSCPL